MPLQAILEAADFDALPDTTILGKDSFVKNEKENKFFLNLPDAEAAKLAFSQQASIAKLTGNNAELLKQKGAANAEAEAFKTLGKSPDELKELLNSKRPEDINKLVADYAAKEESLRKSYEDSLTASNAKAEAAARQLQDTITRATISRLRAEFDLNDTADFVLRDYIRAEPKEEGSADYVTRVYQDGNPALVAGQPMSPEQLIGTFREGKKYLAMFNAGDGGGAGGTNRQATQNNNSKQMKREAFFAMPPAEQSKFSIEGGAVVD